MNDKRLIKNTAAVIFLLLCFCMCSSCLLFLKNNHAPLKINSVNVSKNMAILQADCLSWHNVMPLQGVHGGKVAKYSKYDKQCHKQICAASKCVMSEIYSTNSQMPQPNSSEIYSTNSQTLQPKTSENYVVKTLSVAEFSGKEIALLCIILVVGIGAFVALILFMLIFPVINKIFALDLPCARMFDREFDESAPNKFSAQAEKKPKDKTQVLPTKVSSGKKELRYVKTVRIDKIYNPTKNVPTVSQAKIDVVVKNSTKKSVQILAPPKQASESKNLTPPKQSNINSNLVKKTKNEMQGQSGKKNDFIIAPKKVIQNSQKSCAVKKQGEGQNK